MPQFDKRESSIRLPGICLQFAINSAKICTFVLIRCSKLRADNVLLMPPIRPVKVSDHVSGQCCKSAYRLQSARIKTSESALRRFTKLFSKSHPYYSIMCSNIKNDPSLWALEPTTSTGVGELEDQIVRDPIFGDVSGSGPNYRGVRTPRDDMSQLFS